jgi:hypothetical protein
MDPWPRPARVRVLGVDLAPPTPWPLPSSPLGGRPRCLGEGLPPSSLYKEGAPGEDNTQLIPRVSLPLAATLHLLAIGHLSLSVPCGLPKGCVGERDLTTTARRLAVEFPDPCPMPCTSAILVGSGILGVIVIVVRVRVRRGVARAVQESFLQDLYRP